MWSAAPTWSLCSFSALRTVWRGDSRWQRGKTSRRYSTGPRSRRRISDEAYATRRVRTCLDATHTHNSKYITIFYKCSLGESARPFLKHVNGAVPHRPTRGRASLDREACSSALISALFQNGHDSNTISWPVTGRTHKIRDIKYSEANLGKPTLL